MKKGKVKGWNCLDTGEEGKNRMKTYGNRERRGSGGRVQKALTSTRSSHGNDLIMPDEQLSYVTHTHKELTYNEGSVLLP